MEEFAEKKKKEPVGRVILLARDVKAREQELDVLHHALATAKQGLTPEELIEAEKRIAEEKLN